MPLVVLHTIAITTEAMIGALSASQRSMDLFGMMLTACITALNGDSVRDMLLGHYPLTWVRHPEYLALTAVATPVTVFITPLICHLRSLFLVLDAVGPVAFILTGCQIDLEMGHSLLIATISGMITGVFGDILRDIPCNDVPLIFHRELYASVFLVSAWCYLICMELELPSKQVMLITLFSGFLFRLLTIRFHWEMPKFVYQDDFDYWGKRLPPINTFLQPRACPRCHDP